MLRRLRPPGSWFKPQPPPCCSPNDATFPSIPAFAFIVMRRRIVGRPADPGECDEPCLRLPTSWAHFWVPLLGLEEAERPGPRLPVTGLVATNPPYPAMPARLRPGASGPPMWRWR